MKISKSSIIALLIITILISACAGATSAEVKPPAVQTAPTTAPAKPTEAPKPTSAPKPTDVLQPTFDLNKAVTEFVTTLPDGYYGIKNTDALKALTSDPKPFVVDLREAKEITQTLAGAVNIPVRTLLKNLDKLPAKDQAILLYCGSGHRSAIASALLGELGYTNAKSVSGGVGGWRSAGLPLVDGAPVEPSASDAKVEVNKDLLAALDTWVSSMPDDFWAVSPTSAGKALAGDPKPFMLDVRMPTELESAGYIDGSVNIPLRDLAKNLDKLPADKSAPIITYCAVGQRGGIAMTALRLLGYTNVKNLGGGFGGWVKAGLPVIGGQPAFDLNKAVTEFVTSLPDGYYGIKNTDALKALTADPKPFVVDLREAKEITQTLEGAVNIPVRALLKNLDKLPAKDQAILLYCGSGHRSAIASALLGELGYTNAKSISGGVGGWRSAGLPLVDGAPVEPVASGAKVEVNKDLLAALDTWVSSMPDDFWAVSPTSAGKALAGDPKPFMLDVRMPTELADAGYIDGSVNIPLRDLAKNLDKLPADKSAPIVTYCAVGQRGGIAMTALRLLGYTNVKNLGGGFGGWVKAGLPVVK